MKVEKFVKCLLVAAGTFLAVRGTMEAVRAVKEAKTRRESGEEEESAEQEGGPCIFRGIAMLFAGGLLSGAGLAAHFINFEDRLDMRYPELGEKLHRVDDGFLRAQDFAKDKLAMAGNFGAEKLAKAGNLGAENLAALKAQALSKWNEYLAARAAAGAGDDE